MITRCKVGAQAVCPCSSVDIKNTISTDISQKNQAIKRKKPDGGVSKKDTITSIKMWKKLSLTRPKEPKLETTQRVRAVRIKSSAELEEEMLAKVPKFKARPLNKKMFKAPSLPILPKSTPQLPDFHEFHLKTALRAHPTIIKSSQKLEQEEKEKIPKFKARPLNKKIQPVIPKIAKPDPFHLHIEEPGLQKNILSTLQFLQRQLEEEKSRILKMPPNPKSKNNTNPEIFYLDSLIRLEEKMQKLMEERERIKIEEPQRRIFKNGRHKK